VVNTEEIGKRIYLEYTLACLERVINDKAIQEIWYNSDDPIPLRGPKVMQKTIKVSYMLTGRRDTPS